MPLFGSKFSPRKAPVRKPTANTQSTRSLQDLVADNRRLKLNLGDQELEFESGEWIPISSGKNSNVHKLNHKLKKMNQELQEENNLLTVKYELVLNMLTETTIEKQNQDKELAKLRKSTR